MTRNEIFACAIDWLYAHGKIIGQADLAQKTGITETTISRILNNKVRKPSEDSLRRLNAAFDNIFNPRWLRGEGGEMLAVPLEQPVPEQAPSLDPQSIMAGIENLLEITSKQIKENEELRREFQASIAELREVIKQLKELHPITTYQFPHSDPLGVSEQSTKITK